MSRKTGASRQAKPAVSGSVKSYFAGLASGLFIAFLVNLLDIGPKQFMGSGAEKAAEKTTEKTSAKTERSTTKFDFYTVLPEQEVVVADSAVADPAASKTQQPTTVPPPAVVEKTTLEKSTEKGALEKEKAAPITNLSMPAQTAGVEQKLAGKTQSAESKSAIYLQAGSFRRQADADKRRAELLIHGFRAASDPVNSNGETWYRVQIGPFANDAEMSRARAKLTANGIDTLMTRKK
jgi:cell division protein FtsN